jgi:hypothetical protein
VIHPPYSMDGKGYSFFSKNWKHQECKKIMCHGWFNMLSENMHACAFVIKMHWADPVYVSWGFFHICNN